LLVPEGRSWVGSSHEASLRRPGAGPLGCPEPHLACWDVRHFSDAGFRCRSCVGSPHAARLRAGEPLGILMAGEPAEHRLAERSCQLLACVLATAAVEEFRDRDVGVPDGIIESR
jgi:hypothetical protein